MSGGYNIQEIIFVDESGNPGLNITSIQRSPYFSFGFVYCRDPSALRKHLKRLLRREVRKNHWPQHVHELKFSLPIQDMRKKWGYTNLQIQHYLNYLPRVRQKAINFVLNNSCNIFSAILNKNTIQRSSWTPNQLGNFIFAQTLFSNVIRNIHPIFPPNIIFDAGRLSLARTPAFQGYLMNKQTYYRNMGINLHMGNITTPIPASSQLDPGLWAADIVAGAFNIKYHLNDPSYANMLIPIYIANGERRFWW